MPITIVNHPLVQHKLGLLREADISTYKFRTLTHELARLLAWIKLENVRPVFIELHALQ